MLAKNLSIATTIVIEAHYNMYITYMSTIGDAYYKGMC